MCFFGVTKKAGAISAKLKLIKPLAGEDYKYSHEIEYLIKCGRDKSINGELIDQITRIGLACKGFVGFDRMNEAKQLGIQHIFRMTIYIGMERILFTSIIVLSSTYALNTFMDIVI